jgi:hypothetical protein
MSKFALIKDNLVSRAIRKLVTGNDNGIRSITKPDKPNIITKLFVDGAKLIWNVGGTILKALIGFGFSLARLAGWLISGINALWNFNWNTTDEQFDAQFDSLKLQFVGQLGETVGSVMGYTACGILPSLFMMAFNKQLGYYMLEKVAEEMFEELMGNLYTLTMQIFTAGLKKLSQEAFKSVRRFIKNQAKNPNSSVSLLGKKIFGTRFDSMVKAWGEKNSKPWSFNTYFEEQIEGIEDPYEQEYQEEFWEAAFESCQEAFMIIASSADQWLLQNRNAKTGLLGNQETVEIILDRNIENEPYKETILLSGREELLKPTIVQTLANRQLLEHKDVGVIIGEAINKYAKKIPSEFQVRIYWSSRKDGGKTGEVYTYTTLSNFDKAKLNDWAKIKKLAGGDNGRTYGNVTIKALCDDGSKITVKVQTEEQGKDLIKDLATLTNNKIQWETSNQKIKKEGELAIKYDDDWIEPSITVYPAKIVIFNKYRITNQLNTGETGKIDHKGEYITRQIELPLWTDSEPYNYQAYIQELITIPGISPI